MSYHKLPPPELAARAAFDLHKAASHSFALYKKRIQRIKLKKPSTTSTSAVSQSSLLSGYQFNYSDEHVKLVARELVKNIPSYEEEIQVSGEGNCLFLHSLLWITSCSYILLLFRKAMCIYLYYLYLLLLLQPLRY